MRIRFENIRYIDVAMVRVPSHVKLQSFIKQNCMKSNLMKAWLRNFIQMFRPVVLLRYHLHSWYKCLPRVEVSLCNDSVKYSDSNTCCLVCQASASCEAQRIILFVCRRGSCGRYGGLWRSGSALCCVRKRSSIALLCVAWDVST